MCIFYFKAHAMIAFNSLEQNLARLLTAKWVTKMNKKHGLVAFIFQKINDKEM